MTRPGESPQSISVSKKTYDRLEAYCERAGIAVASWVEIEVAKALGHPVPKPRKFRKRRSRNV